MTESDPEAPEDGSTEEQMRRRRAAKLLGGLLPAQTSDETAEGWGDGGPASRDDEIRGDVPPHHGA
jgi:hypothetical protein